MNPERRRLLQGLGATSIAFLGLRQAIAGQSPPASRFAALRPDPDRVLDLPAGFSASVISRAGETMSDGWRVPGMADGMACFAADEGRWALVRNHELDASSADLAMGPFGKSKLSERQRQALYDPGRKHPPAGGTTTLIYNPATRSVEKQFLSLAGTERNCAGGPTPWNTWLSCEESVSGIDRRHAREHGYVFEVSPSDESLRQATPLAAMGRFNHEAAAVDPVSGAVYLTEDRADGLFYRFVPRTPGKLADGGQLQALAIDGPSDTRNWKVSRMQTGQEYSVRWITLEAVESPEDDLRHQGASRGAALFARGEGLWWGTAEAYFCCTNGGRKGAGQVFRYRPSPMEGRAEETSNPARLSLFVESDQPSVLDHCDNLTVTPWGDLLLCEDSQRHCGLVGVTAEGELYRFANNPYNRSELAGACFSPDGSTLFVNVQAAGLTIAITGPFPASG